MVIHDCVHSALLVSQLIVLLSSSWNKSLFVLVYSDSHCVAFYCTKSRGKKQFQSARLAFMPALVPPGRIINAMHCGNG